MGATERIQISYVREKRISIGGAQQASEQNKWQFRGFGLDLILLKAIVVHIKAIRTRVFFVVPLHCHKVGVVGF